MVDDEADRSKTSGEMEDVCLLIHHRAVQDGDTEHAASMLRECMRGFVSGRSDGYQGLISKR